MGWYEVAALAVAAAAAVGVTWQIARAEQGIPLAAWAPLVLQRQARPGVLGFEVRLEVLGPNVVYDVKPFVTGPLALLEMTEPIPKFTSESAPIRWVLEVNESALVGLEGEDRPQVGIVWLTVHRRSLVDRALQLDPTTSRVQHWLWSRSPVPLRFRRNPRGRWGVRNPWLSRHLVPIPGFGRWTKREDDRRAAEWARRPWPPSRSEPPAP